MTWLTGKLIVYTVIFVGLACPAYALTDEEKRDYQERVEHDNLIISAHALFIEGVAFLRMGHLVEALAKIEEGLKIEPDNENAVYNKAVILHTLGRFAEATDAYNYILINHPDSQAADYARTMLANIGITYGKDGAPNDINAKTAKAVQAANKSASVLSDSINVLRTEGTEALREKRYDIAENRFTTLLEIDHTDAGAWYYLGKTYSNKLEYSKAINAYSTSLEINPRSVVANDARKSLQVLSTTIRQAEPFVEGQDEKSVVEQDTKENKHRPEGIDIHDKSLVPLQ